MEKTEAGLKGLCIREIMTKYTLLIHKILYYNTTVSDAMEICFVIMHTSRPDRSRIYPNVV